MTDMTTNRPRRTSPVRASLWRIRSTRSILRPIGLFVAYPTIIVSLASSIEGDSLRAQSLVGMIRGAGDLGMFVFAVAGALLVGGAYHHQTIVPMLFVRPDRRSVLFGDVSAMAATAAAATTVSILLATTAGLIVLPLVDAPGTLLTRELLLAAIGAVTVNTVYAVLGGLVGALVRNPIASIVGILVWMFAIEGLLPLVLRKPALGRWLPGGAAEGLLRLGAEVPGVLSPTTAGLVIAAVIAGLGAITLPIVQVRDL